MWEKENVGKRECGRKSMREKENVGEGECGRRGRREKRNRARKGLTFVYGGGGA